MLSGKPRPLSDHTQKRLFHCYYFFFLDLSGQCGRRRRTAETRPTHATIVRAYLFLFFFFRTFFLRGIVGVNTHRVARAWPTRVIIVHARALRTGRRARCGRAVFTLSPDERTRPRFRSVSYKKTAEITRPKSPRARSILSYSIARNWQKVTGRVPGYR